MVWQKAGLMILDAYRSTRGLPKEEL